MNNEVKTYTIVDTETQKTKEIKSTATTVAELKRDLRQNGFNVEGKTIQEALTRTEFKDDSSVLPHDVPYKGTTTNDLVFRLTKTNKQVRSGMDRQTAYAKVKELGLGEAIKAKFGKNFTQVSTNDLVEFINADGEKGTPAKKEEPKKEEPKKAAPKAEKENPGTECKCMGALRNLCSILEENGTIDSTDIEAIFGSEGVPAPAASDDKSKYSKDELNDLLSGL